MSTTLLLALLAPTAALAQTRATTDPTLHPILDKMAQYIASCGEKASMFVGIETYTQSVSVPGAPATRPHRLVAEFAIVKAPGDTGWIGFRDVVEYDGKKVSDRRDRLMTILTDSTSDANQVIQLANESARYNVGPISRNFNTPTSTLFFFHPANLSRFIFTRNGVRKIDGIDTVEIAFKESQSPTLVRRRSGVDVPSEGRLWVLPVDGTVVRSHLVLRNFADYVAPTGTIIDTMADIDVTYSHHAAFNVWLPLRMTEMYAGPIVTRMTTPPVSSTATTRATYSDFRQFDTGVKINILK